MCAALAAQAGVAAGLSVGSLRCIHPLTAACGRVGLAPWLPGVSYSYYLSTAGKVCVMVCMMAGKLRRVWGPSTQLEALCQQA